jgi:hypothetical protein
MLGKNNMNIGLRDIYRLLVGRRGNDFWEKSHPLHFAATLLACINIKQTLLLLQRWNSPIFWGVAFMSAF